MRVHRVGWVLVGLLAAGAPPAAAHPLEPLQEATMPAVSANPSTLWIVAAAVNLVMAVTFLGIAWTMWRAITDGDQWSSNPLLLGMAGIFTFCSIGHFLHFEHAMLPFYAPLVGLEAPNMTTEFGLWARTAMATPALALVDVATAGLGVVYFTMRREQRHMFRGAELSEDLRVLEGEARVLQDSIVQTTTEALLLLDEGLDAEAAEKVDEAVERSKHIVDQFFDEEAGRKLGAGDLSLTEDPAES